MRLTGVGGTVNSVAEKGFFLLQNMTTLCHTSQVSFKIDSGNSLTKKVLSVLCNQSLTRRMQW